jgi:hypothetical protein
MGEIVNFSAVLVFVMVATTNAFYVRDVIMDKGYGSEVESEIIYAYQVDEPFFSREFLLRFSMFGRRFLRQLNLVFGDFSTEEYPVRNLQQERADFYGIFLTFVSVMFMSLLMMNLLIGIISESLGKLYDSRVRNNYYMLCQIILDFEILIFCRRFVKAKPEFLLFAHYIEDEQELERKQGRMQVTAERIHKLRDNMQTMEDNMILSREKMDKTVNNMEE